MIFKFYCIYIRLFEKLLLCLFTLSYFTTVSIYKNNYCNNLDGECLPSWHCCLKEVNDVFM